MSMFTDKIPFFTTRHIQDAVPGTFAGTLKLSTDPEGSFMLDVTTESGEGAGLYMDKDARKELISILLKTL